MTTDRPTPRMHEDEILVDDDTVRALLQDQFPKLGRQAIASNRRFWDRQCDLSIG